MADFAVTDSLTQEMINRLQSLAGRMLDQFPKLRRWNDSKDVLQESLVRLWQALRTIRPESERHFFNLAALQMRRTLIDLQRQLFGAEGLAANYGTVGGATVDAPARRAAGQGLDAIDLIELHDLIERLPAETREVIDLLYVHGLRPGEAANRLGISVRTLQLRRNDALADLRRQTREPV